MAKRRKTKPSATGAEPSARGTAAALDLADERIVDPSELLARIPLDRSTIYRMVQEGRFPAPIQLTSSRIGWRWSAILRWLATREADPVKARTFFGRDKDKHAPTEAA